MIDFLIIAFTIFLVLKAMNTFKRKAEEASQTPPEPPAQEVLLKEIRDILKEKK